MKKTVGRPPKDPSDKAQYKLIAINRSDYVKLKRFSVESGELIINLLHEFIESLG